MHQEVHAPRVFTVEDVPDLQHHDEKQNRLNVRSCKGIYAGNVSSKPAFVFSRPMSCSYPKRTPCTHTRSTLS